MITPVIPISLVIIPGVLIALYSSQDVFGQNPILFIVTWGLMASKVSFN